VNRSLTALFAAAEALLVLAIGVAIPLAIGSVLWAVHFGFDPEWAVFWRAAADLWLLGHGVDVTFTLDAALAAAIGVPGAERPVTITIALLGFAVLTVALAVRTGRRVAEAGHPLLGGLVAIGAFAAADVAVVLLSLHPAARASIVQGVVLPPLVFAIGMVFGMLTSADRADRLRERGADAGLASALTSRLPVPLARSLLAAVRTALGAAAGLIAVASLVTAVAIVVGYARLITLYETLHTEVLGGVVLTIAQFAILPNLVVWAASWLVGPGFAVGVGSSVGPFGTGLGPIPPVPVLGAIPESPGPLAWLGLVAPIVVGFVAAALAARRLPAPLGWLAVPVGLGGGALGGLAVGLLAAASAGAGGPGRLAELGPDPVQIGVWAGLEFAAAALAAFLTVRPRGRGR